jgi:hypothetical protein
MLINILLIALVIFIVYKVFTPSRENMKAVTLSQPYNFKYGGLWPPDMYSRLYYWSPGFYNGSGLSLQFRPGMENKNFPRNRWIDKTNMGNSVPYYKVSNRDDYKHDMANYSELPLRFRT